MNYFWKRRRNKVGIFTVYRSLRRKIREKNQSSKELKKSQSLTGKKSKKVHKIGLINSLSPFYCHISPYTLTNYMCEWKGNAKIRRQKKTKTKLLLQD